MIKHNLIAISVSFLAVVSSYGQLSVNALLTDYTIDFENTVAGVSNGTFSGAGFQAAPSVGRLDSDAWTLTNPNMPYGSNAIGGVYALGCGGGGINDQGGVYCFQGGSIAGRALGIHPSASAFVPGVTELRVLNNTGDYITSLSLSYNLHVRNDDNRSNSFNTSFFYSTVNNGYNSITNNMPYAIDFSSMAYSSPGAGTPGSDFFAVPMNETLNGLYVKPGDYFYIRWSTADVSGTGTRDEFGIDDIVINVDGSPELTFYSQNSGVLSTSNFSSTALWSTVPTGGLAYKMRTLVPEATFRVQNGHTTTLTTSSYRMTLDNLVVDAGGAFQTNTTGTSPSQRYLNVWGDVTVNGSIGTPSGANSGLGLNLNPGAHVISGSGTTHISRIRKSNTNYPPGNIPNGYCELSIQTDMTLLWTASALYNGRAASNGGTNIFDVTIESGATVSTDGFIGMDQTDPTSNTIESGGTYTVLGTLNVAQALYLTTNNNVIPCGLTIGSGGIVNAAYVRSDATGTAGHTLNMLGNSLLNLTGNPADQTTWLNYSTVNNVYNFQPNSTIEYSKAGLQDVDVRLTYRNLVNSGSGVKLVFGGGGLDLVVLENLDIEGSAILTPNGHEIEVHGHWTNYNQSGFDEVNELVNFINDGSPGTTSITCPGGEDFFNLGISAGTTLMNDAVTVTNTLSLDARLDLNGNELLISEPATGLSIVTPTGNEVVVSEDDAHAGRITRTIDSFTGPVVYPFGTSAGIPIYSRFRLNSGIAGDVSMATYGTTPDNLPWPTSPVAVNNLASTIGLAPDNRTATVDRFWSIELTEATAVADVEFSFVDSEVPGAPHNTPSLLRAQRYDLNSNQWQTALPGQFVLTGTHSPTTTTVVVPNVAQFSPWAVASDNSPLPVELLSFDGKTTSTGINLNWSTASEIDNDGFELWKSADDVDFQFLSWISGAGNSSTVLEYEHTDIAPFVGMNYYKLIQKDFDGTADESDVIGIEWQGEEGSLSLDLYTSDVLRGRLSKDIGPITIEVFNSAGRLVMSETSAGSQFSFDIRNLSRGQYIVRVASKTQLISGRFIR